MLGGPRATRPVAIKSFFPPTKAIPLVHLLAAALDNDDNDDGDDVGDIERDFIGDLVAIQRYLPLSTHSCRTQADTAQMLVAAHVPQQREATRPYSKHSQITCASSPSRFIHTGSHHASISSLLVVVPILYATKVIPPLLKTLGMHFYSHVSAQ
ncbi:hypothetical protein BKA70DRAFT_1423844 [Coprinopsis sp. MPI-PUGE-AT-0042]|nr:hypothetical protein BKA70DRAFT_1423844 [Coprinopsis sp. MPI-PUGE-AT-0042]